MISLRRLRMKRLKTGNVARGFTMIELLVAMAVFLIIAGTAFSLFAQHAALAAHQENLSGVNIGARNAMAQLQIDLAGAGANLLSSVTNAQPFSMGVIIQNNVPGVATACAPNTTTWAYPLSSACFDSLSVVNLKPCTTGSGGGATAPVLVINDTAPPENLNTNTLTYADDPNASGNVAALTADATCYKSGDELLIVSLPTSPTNEPTCAAGQFNYCITAVKLTADSSEVAQPAVKLTHTLTGSAGAAAGCPGVSCSDPLGVVGSSNYQNALAKSFVNSTTYIINLGTGSNDITYGVLANPSNASDPQLVRCLGAVCTAGNSQVITDQVVGFKVGAALWDNGSASATDIANYFYDGSKYCTDAIAGADCTTVPPPANDAYDFTLVRSIRVSMVARTTPQLDPTLAKFANGFDGGPYLVQQASVVVDLRNMTIPDFGN